MGKEMITLKTQSPEKMVVEISKIIKRVCRSNHWELDSFQIDKLSVKFYSNEYSKYSINMDGYDKYPAVRMESWLLEQKYLSESS